LLRPNAEHVDVHGVPRSHLEALAAAGIFGVSSPRDVGGSDVGPATMREITETLAGADASTWFVWTQHHTPVRTLRRSDNDTLKQKYAAALAAGAVVSGVAFTHLRRAGPPPVTATRDGDGWTLSGRIDWLTGWELSDVFLVGAQAGTDVVWSLLSLPGRPGVTSAALGLAAMAGTATVSVTLKTVAVDAADVVLVEPLDDWRAADRQRTADVSPAVFGLTAEAVRRLTERGDAMAHEIAANAAAELERVRASAYQLMDDADPAERIDERLALRAEAHALALRTTAALVTVGAGRSMLLDAPAQRLAREALFLLVQGQTAAVREATLRRLAQ
jgi:alkylation response protein AidB-like acyl-CoA dehydrogenase